MLRNYTKCNSGYRKIGFILAHLTSAERGIGLTYNQVYFKYTKSYTVMANQEWLRYAKHCLISISS